MILREKRFRNKLHNELVYARRKLKSGKLEEYNDLVEEQIIQGTYEEPFGNIYIQNIFKKCRRMRG